MRGPITLLQDAISIFTSNPKLYLGIYLIPAVLTFLYGVYAGVEGDDLFTNGQSILVSLIFFVILIIANIMMAVAMVKAISAPESMSIKSAYSFARSYILQYLWVSFLVGITVMAGMILLIIPGIIFAVWFSFSYLILIFEGKRGTDAMKASKAYVSGYWWQVFGRMAFMVVISILVSVILGVIGVLFGEIGEAVMAIVSNALIVPVAIGYSYLMYRDLQKLKSAAETQQEPTVTSPLEHAAAPNDQTM